jgi:transglutaminase-like putative cysteine protease
MRPGPRLALFTITNGVTACMMIAALSLLAVEAIGPVHALVLAGTILWGRWRSKPTMRPIAWDLLALAALLFFPFDLFLLSRSLIGAALRLLSFVIIYRCSNLSGRRELRQAVALSFVQVLAAAASTTEAYFGLLLAAYLSMAIWTLMAMASARDDAPPTARRAPAGRPVLVMTAATIALGGVLFFVMPHFGTGYLQQATSMRAAADGLSGFSNRIELGSISRIKKNHAIVMRVRVTAARGDAAAAAETMKWRGLALDSFDGRSWSVGDSDARWLGMESDGWFAVGPPAPDAQPTLEEEISMEPSLMSLLFVSPGATRIYSDAVSAIGVDSGGSIHLQTPLMRRFRYRVISPAPEIALAGFEFMPTENLPRYLTLPRVDPRVEALAKRIAPETGSDFDKARLIEDYLRANYTYTLDVDDKGVADPVAHFLIEKNPGHCEYFATSMAVLLRYLGIPSRVVNGFASGQWSGLTGSFIVRQSDAHSWVEAWIAGRGWVTFDPTPADATDEAGAGLLARVSRAMDRAEIMWDTWIIGLDLLDQQSLVSTAVDAVRAAGSAVRKAAAWTVSIAGSSALPGLVALVSLIGFIAAKARIWRFFGWRRGRPGGGSAATDLLRRFEARWAARGVRRPAGQTPLEFAREIERRALDKRGAALEFVETYYRARYGG